LFPDKDCHFPPHNVRLKPLCKNTARGRNKEKDVTNPPQTTKKVPFQKHKTKQQNV